MRKRSDYPSSEKVENLISSTECLNAAVQELLESVGALLEIIGSANHVFEIDMSDDEEVDNDGEIH